MGILRSLFGSSKTPIKNRYGNIYRVDVNDKSVRYFWDIGADNTQLNSALIVVFLKTYQKTEPFDPAVVTADAVDFYCHTIIPVGKKLKCWTKVGFRPVDREFPMTFRQSDDHGNPKIRVSSRWWVWKPNQPMRYIGKLTASYWEAEIGSVKNPPDIVARIQSGAYKYFYPAYE